MMVTQLGFSDELGQVAWQSGGGPTFLGQQMAQPGEFSMATANTIDAEVKALVERAYRRAKDLVQVRDFCTWHRMVNLSNHFISTDRSQLLFHQYC